MLDLRHPKPYNKTCGVCSQGLYYALLGRPSPVLGILDFYLLVPLGKLFQKQWRVSELTLRERMGGGNFGQARPVEAGRVLPCAG